MKYATPNDLHRKKHNPKEDLDALETSLAQARDRFSLAAQETGYQLDVVRAIRPCWSVPGVPDFGSVPTLASGAAVLHDWRQQAENWSNEAATLQGDIVAASSTDSGIAYATVAVGTVYPPLAAIDWAGIRAVADRKEENEFIYQGLKAIDTTLADTYLSLWQYEHIGAFDPERGPLFLMRQVFDHLLSFLAPDTEVASQPDFVPDTQLKKRNGVGITKVHRIQYVAATRVKDAGARATLLASTNSNAPSRWH